VLHPEVVLRSDVSKVEEQHGANRVARMALVGARRNASVLPVLVNGTAGAVIVEDGRPSLVMAFTVSADRIVEFDVITGPERLRHIELAGLTG
jgi:hypothetical protein